MYIGQTRAVLATGAQMASSEDAWLFYWKSYLDFFCQWIWNKPSLELDVDLLNTTTSTRDTSKPEFAK